MPPAPRFGGGAGPSGLTPSGASASGSTKFFFPPAETSAGTSGVGGSYRGTYGVPPPPSPHYPPTLSGTPLHGAWTAGGGLGVSVNSTSVSAAATAAAATFAAEEDQEAEYRMLCGKVLEKKDHKEVAIRRTVMALLPELAAFYPGGTEDFLEPAVWFLVHIIRQVGFCCFGSA